MNNKKLWAAPLFAITLTIAGTATPANATADTETTTGEASDNTLELPPGWEVTEVEMDTDEGKAKPIVIYFNGRYYAGVQFPPTPFFQKLFGKNTGLGFMIVGSETGYATEAEAMGVARARVNGENRGVIANPNCLPPAVC